MKEPLSLDFIDKDGELICKCECGGNVLGVRDFGRLWTWCDRCTPVLKVTIRRGMVEQDNERLLYNTHRE